MYLQTFVGSLVWLTLVLGAFLVVVAGINRWFLGRLPWETRFSTWAAITTLLAAVLITYFKRLSLRQVARRADRIAGTNDRFLTALTFSNSASENMRNLALRECSSFIEKHNFRNLIRIRIPRESAWIVAPIATLLLLQLDARNNFAINNLNRAAGQREVAATVRALTQLAATTEKKAEETNDDALKKLAAKMRQDAKELGTNAINQDEAAKSAMRQLASLEQFVQELQKPPMNATSEELKALAKALETNEATKEAAAALQAGNLAEAAKALESAAKEENPEKAAEALQRALDELAKKKELSEALKQLSRESQKPGSEGQKSSDALKRLAKMLRQSSQSGPGKQNPQQQQLSKQTLQELLSAIQNLKYAENQDGAGNKPVPGKETAGKDLPMAIEPSGQKNEGGTPNPGDPRLASGQPGSEHDEGTTETPFGEKTTVSTEKPKEAAIRGQLGEGESLSTLRASGADNDKASRRYKELYESLAPTAQEAVMQEEIPLGSRLFIKRYFEAIRP
ncbi:MAG: hypothetical protein JWL59_3993 [Chthoniobacteraceae bacterium]|nr:hypothetical protein [Chthoniobacteraceae bacterium]